MSPVCACVAIVYLVAAAAVGLYACAQLHLLLRSFGRRAALPAPVDGTDLPMVTVQLPIRNERRVVCDLLEAVAALDWPADRLSIQVLDDSDDETVALAAAACERLRGRGVRIHHLRRAERDGFKAGALRWGLERAEGEFVAIFDADFRPRPCFLRRAMRVLLERRDVGLVQARWSHLNRDESLFTAAQAFHLDAHFAIEQEARGQRPLWMGFNGTAGVWRRACIEAAGGWSADTLTEDLDLSFRAQLAGWPLVYLDALDAPAELPADVRAIRSQQHRWMKGGAQVGRKLLRTLWASDRPLVTKLQGTAHLCGGSVFAAVTVLCLLTPVIQVIARADPGVGWILAPAGWLLQFALVVLLVFYATMCLRRDGGLAGGWRFVRTFPPFLMLSTGLSLHNAVAVAEGWAGRPGVFVRTPKRGRGDLAPYAAGPVGWTTWAELGLSLWGFAGLAVAVGQGSWVGAAFLACQALGFAAVGLGTLARVGAS